MLNPNDNILCRAMGGSSSEEMCLRILLGIATFDLSFCERREVEVITFLFEENLRPFSLPGITMAVPSAIDCDCCCKLTTVKC